MNTPLRLTALALSLLLAACGREEAAAPAPAEPAPEAAVEATPAPTEPAVADPAPIANHDAALAASDLDAYVRGMQREIQVLQGHADALARARQAKDANGEMTAMMALNGVEIRDAGAAAAGLEIARYATVKEKIDDVLSAIEMGAAMRPQLEAAEQADLSGFTDEQRQQHEAGLAQMRAAWGAPYERLPADLVDTFKSREAELARLRADALALRLGALKQ